MSERLPHSLKKWLGVRPEEPQIGQQKKRRLWAPLGGMAFEGQPGTSSGGILHVNETMSILPWTFEGGFVRFVEVDGYVRMVIELGENCALDDIKNQWPEIKMWQRFLLKTQGPSISDGQGALYQHLQHEKEAGRTYSEMAKWVNQVVVNLLQGYLVMQWELTRTGREHWKAEEFYAWLQQWERKGIDWLGEIHARELLRSMGLSKQDAKEWCDSALDNLMAGKPAFLPEGGPIDKERVRSRLRAWTNTLKGVEETG